MPQPPHQSHSGEQTENETLLLDDFCHIEQGNQNSSLILGERMSSKIVDAIDHRGVMLTHLQFEG